MITKHNIKLDFSKKEVAGSATYTQGDVNTSVLELEVLDDGQEVVLSDYTIALLFKLNSGTLLIAHKNKMTVEGNNISYLLTNELEIAGKLQCQLKLIKNDEIKSSMIFDIFIQKTLANLSKIASDDAHIPLIIRLLDANENLKTKENKLPDTPENPTQKVLLGDRTWGDMPDNLAEKSINSFYLSNNYNDRGVIDSESNLNDVLNTGSYLVVGTPTNMPDGFTSGRLLVTNLGDRWIYQKIIGLHDVNQQAERVADVQNNVFNNWKILEIENTGGGTIDDSSITRSKLIANFSTNKTVSDADINTLLQEGHALLMGNYTNGPAGFTGNAILDVEVAGNDSRWVKQTIRRFLSNDEFFIRVLDVQNIGDAEWKKVLNISELPSFPEASASASLLNGKTIVNLGDSIFGNVRDNTSVSGVLASITGATVHNIGLGGTRAGEHIGHWSDISFYALADAIATNNYAVQDEALNHDDRTSYMEEQLAKLKAINFENVDYITLNYGTNDFTSGRTLEDGSDKLATYTYKGALRYGIEKIMTAYPHVKLVLISPTWRWWGDENNAYVDDSDTRTNSKGNTLKTFVNAMKEVAEEYHCAFIDAYEIGINKHNCLGYFHETDGTHHKAEGRRRLAERLSFSMSSEY